MIVAKEVVAGLEESARAATSPVVEVGAADRQFESVGRGSRLWRRAMCHLADIIAAPYTSGTSWRKVFGSEC